MQFCVPYIAFYRIALPCLALDCIALHCIDIDIVLGCMGLCHIEFVLQHIGFHWPSQCHSIRSHTAQLNIIQYNAIQARVGARARAPETEPESEPGPAPEPAPELGPEPELELKRWPERAFSRGTAPRNPSMRLHIRIGHHLRPMGIQSVPWTELELGSGPQLEPGLEAEPVSLGQHISLNTTQ